MPSGSRERNSVTSRSYCRMRSDMLVSSAPGSLPFASLLKRRLSLCSKYVLSWCVSSTAPVSTMIGLAR